MSDPCDAYIYRIECRSSNTKEIGVESNPDRNVWSLRRHPFSCIVYPNRQAHVNLTATLLVFIFKA